MNVSALNFPREAAAAALLQYKAHRGTHDARDWEIERIYRCIAKGKTVISVTSAIQNAGLDELGRPKLAIARADELEISCALDTGRDAHASFRGCALRSRWEFRVPLPMITRWQNLRALVPRIPPQHRPATKALPGYHILFEADWSGVPDDPYLLRRIGKDAFLVVAAYELTDVEMSVLRAYRPMQ